MELTWSYAEKHRQAIRHHKAAEENDDHGIPGKWIWRKKKCGQLEKDSTRQSLMETKWSVAFAPLETTPRHKSLSICVQVTDDTDIGAAHAQ